VVDSLLDGDVTRVAGYSTRFAGVIYPGETLHTRVWEDDKRLLVSSAVGDRPVLAGTVMTIA
jgi:acyl dehydratase